MPPVNYGQQPGAPGTLPMQSLAPGAVAGRPALGVAGQKLGPETEKAAAKAKDPFADLAVL